LKSIPEEQNGEESELQAALRKIIIPKLFNREELKKMYNLNKVSATCAVLGLKKNTYTEVFLKAG